MALSKEQQSQINDCKDSDGKIVKVPEYILDLVDEKSQAYFEKNKHDDSRLLAAYGKEAKDFIRDKSTHTDHSAKRRDIHREIILDMIEGKKAPENAEQQNIYLFAGPPGAGKSTLREKFDADEELENPELESIRQQYKKDAKPESMVSVDFGIFKAKLPEYNAANTAKKEKDGFGDMYGVIRAEASGLNEAIQQFAKDAGLTSVREQLMDIDVANNTQIQEEIQDTKLTVIGVTADPETTRSRVKEREKPMKDEEVVRAIQTFSDEKAFETLAKFSDKAVLVTTDSKKYKTVMTSDKGVANINNQQELDKFKSYKDFEPAQAVEQQVRTL